jgi:hypothetical protein
MQPAEVGVADRQIAVGVLPGVEEVAVPGAVHRLDAVLLLVDLHQEHVVVEGVVVARRLPQLGLVDERGDDLGVAVAAIEAAGELHQSVVDERALRMEEGGARGDRVE